MNFIKNLFKAIKNFFVNLFGKNKQEQKADEAEKQVKLKLVHPNDTLQEMEELIADVAPETLEPVDDIDLECGILFDHILQMSKEYGYPLHEALKAYIANDKDTLLNIEMQMVDRLYEATIQNHPAVDRFLERKEILQKRNKQSVPHLRVVK